MITGQKEVVMRDLLCPPILLEQGGSSRTPNCEMEARISLHGGQQQYIPDFKAQSF